MLTSSSGQQGYAVVGCLEKRKPENVALYLLSNQLHLIYKRRDAFILIVIRAMYFFNIRIVSYIILCTNDENPHGSETI